MSHLYGIANLVRVFVHFSALALLLSYQFLFNDFVNPSLAIPLYFVFSAIFLCDGVLFLFSSWFQDKKWIYFFFFLDSLLFFSFVLFMGWMGLILVLFFSIFLLFALSLCSGWFHLSSFTLGLMSLLLIALLWRGEMEHRFLMGSVMFSTFLLNFLFGGFIGQWVRSLYQGHLEKNVTFETKTSQSNLSLAKELAHKIQSGISYLASSLSDNFQNKGEKSNSFYNKNLKEIQVFLDEFIELTESKEIHLKPCNLNKIIKNTVQKLSTHADRPKNLKESAVLNSSGCVQGSPVHLEKALKSLVLNSFQALKLEKQPSLQIVTYDESDHFVLEISDNGHGMTKEEQEKVFDPLFSKRWGMRGLGLAFVFKIICAHKGRISIESELGKGTQIQVKLPLHFIENNTRLTLSA